MDNSNPHSRYSMRWTYMGFETGTTHYCESETLEGVIAEGMGVINGRDGVYHYLNVYRDKKFIGRIGKDGFVSAE